MHVQIVKILEVSEQTVPLVKLIDVQSASVEEKIVKRDSFAFVTTEIYVQNTYTCCCFDCQEVDFRIKKNASLCHYMFFFYSRLIQFVNHSSVLIIYGFQTLTVNNINKISFKFNVQRSKIHFNILLALERQYI